MRGHAAGLSALCAALAVAGVASNARAADQDTAASTFAVRTVRFLVANRYGDAWPSLHPSHQRVTGGRRRYVRCELEVPFVERATAVEGLGVWDETVPIAGIGRVRTKAVTIRVAFAGIESAAVHTVHVLSVRGSWRWVLPRARYASYRRGWC